MKFILYNYPYQKFITTEENEQKVIDEIRRQGHNIAAYDRQVINGDFVELASHIDPLDGM